MRLIIAEFGQETNTFSPSRLDFQAFSGGGWKKKETVLENFRHTGTYLGGAIDEAEREAARSGEPIELIPLDSVTVTGGAPMSRECFDYAVGHFLDDVRTHWKEADGMFFAEHGGGGAEGIEDLEIYLLKEIRKITGPEFPIVSSLDMHACITEEFCALTDGLFVIKEFPHSDMADAAAMAMRSLIRTVRTGFRPVMTVVNLPLILPNTTTCTTVEPMKSVKEHFAQVSREKGFIDCSLVQGYSANDQYWSGTSVLILSDRKEEETAKELALYFWKRRKEFDPHPVSAKEAVNMAEAFPGPGYALIHETTDNPGSGCPGDGTHLLRELIERNLPGSVFAMIFDPETAEQAWEAGAGAVISVRLGGKCTDRCGEPLELHDVRVLALSDGEFVFRGSWRTCAKATVGRSALLRYKNTEIVVSSILDQTFDDGPLRIFGRKPEDYRIVAIKSAGHFRGYYESRAGKIIPCETPGLRSSDLRSYPYVNIRRPVYPLDSDTTFSGEA